MSSIVINDIFDELKCEINRLNDSLCYERQLNKILENIKNNSILMKNNCNCIENIDIFKTINDLEIQYKLLKTRKPINKTLTAQTLDTNAFNKSSTELIVAENGAHLDTTSNASVSITVTKPIEWQTSANSSENMANIADTSEDQKNVICNKCKQAFDTELDLVLHVNRNHRNVESFVCHECQEVFNSNEDFSGHLSEHQNSRDKLQETTTNLRNRTIDSLRSYRKSSHSLLVSPGSNGTDSSRKTDSDFNFVSDLLEASTSTEQIKDNQLLVDQFECSECNNVLQSYYDLEDHIKQNHSNLVCQQCKLWYNSKEDIKIHYRTVHKIPMKIFSCDSCNFTSLSNISLNLHIKRKHAEPVDKRLTPSEPNTEMTTIVDKTDDPIPKDNEETTAPEAKDNRCYNKNCESFGREYSSNRSLRRHMKLCLKRSKAKNKTSSNNVSNRFSNMVLKNTKEGVFCCEFCDYKTNKKYYYKRHRDRVHFKSKDNFVFCDINGCGKSFSRKDILLSHQKRCHSDVNRLESTTFGKSLETTVDMNISSNNFPIVNKIEAILPDIPVGEQIKLEYISDSDNESGIDKTKPEIDLKDLNIPKNKSNITNRLRIHFTKIQPNPQNRGPISRPFNCDYPGCHKSFSKSRYVSDHKRKVHRNGSRSMVSALTSHSRRSEPNTSLSSNESPSVAKTHSCDFDGCQYKTNRRDSLLSHQRRVHKIEHFICNYPNCRHRFATLMLMRQHMNTHKNRFVCKWDGCQFRTDTFAKLNEHKRLAKHSKLELLESNE